tara:strand:- start:29 stop:463 length:435 start_codon:yes stop_codon:yes gene_type:complete
MNIQKNNKPAEADIHLKYICHSCGSEHWISLKENQTPRYKIVCFSCDVVIMPKPVAQVKLLFAKQDTKQNKTKQQPQPSQTDSPVLDVVQRCAVTLVSYGFEKEEALSLAEKAAIKYNIDNVSDLVKKIIFDFGAINEPKTTEI